MSIASDAIQWFNPRLVERTDGKNLPHLVQRDTVYFVTFRLFDSLPSDIVLELRLKRDRWLATNLETHTEEQLQAVKRLYSLPIERYLDAGHGKCLLKRGDCRDELLDVLLRFDGDTYRLGDYVIMPNHVHMLVQVRRHKALSRVCWRWKNLSAKNINRLLRRRGNVWQSEAFDHIVRSPAKLAQCRRYIQMNPRGLPDEWYTLGCGSLFDDVGGGEQAPF